MSLPDPLPTDPAALLALAPQIFEVMKVLDEKDREELIVRVVSAAMQSMDGETVLGLGMAVMDEFKICGEAALNKATPCVRAVLEVIEGELIRRTVMTDGESSFESESGTVFPDGDGV